MNASFREATAADLEPLMSMMRELYAHDNVPFDEERSRTAALGLLSAPEYGRLWLITSEGEIAGYCILTFGYSLEYHGRHGFIDELFVTEPYRNKGLGGMAVEHASTLCRSLGMRVILLEVAFENVRAEALYRRMGFAEHGRRLMSREVNGNVGN